MEIVMPEMQENIRQSHASEGHEKAKGKPQTIFKADKQALRDSALDPA